MAIVNFAIPKALEQRIKKVMREKGFPSKAELFRFATIRYLDETEKLPLGNDPEIAALTAELGRELSAKFSGKKLPSVREQLKQFKDH